MIFIDLFSDNFHERMLDDMDDAHSVHSIGVVENPLYAEHEEVGPSYAELQKKEKEVCDLFGLPS